jgi:Cu(I)/Ag(I) efflux system membrane fusion protein
VNSDDRGFETKPAATPPPARPGGGPRRAIVAALLVLAGAGLGVTATRLATHAPKGAHGGDGVAEAKPLYQCPMHPTITSDHPGECPICGMELVLVKGPGARKAAAFEAPGERSTVEGLATVTIDPARQQLIGLRTAPVSRGSVSGSWRTVGRVQVDPTRVRNTNVKVEGYIEQLYVDFVGRPVRRGQPLFALYSPSLLAAENEYVLALTTRDALGAAGATGASSGDGAALVDAARRKLQLWDVPAAEIARLERTRTPARTLTFLSPVAGVVTAKNVIQGARVNAGDTPFEITDLGEVWVMADAYEGDLANVHVGMPATLTLKAYPGRTFRGNVAFIDPLLDAATRTAKVHMHFHNPDAELKPEMFGDVVLEGKDRAGLVIPTDAVVRSGTRDVVFLALGAGKFTPREVQLGDKSGAEVEVRSGLTEGEQVVTRANFLVDSESQLRASLAALTEKQP